jgi:hypothetical protein
MVRVARIPTVAFAALLGVLYLALNPPSADVAAHLYRADLVQRAGLVVWDNNWYGGHNLPGYSLLFPWLGALIGVRLAGALSALAATAVFARLAADEFEPGAARAASAWFAVGMTATVVSGRLAFAFGTAVGAAALLAATRHRAVLAALLGAATTLSSPVAGLFLILIAAAWLIAGPGLRSAPTAAWTVALGAAATGLALALTFPEGGTEPFVASSFWPALAATGLGLWVAAEGPRPLRTAIALYGLLLVAAFVLPTPQGGNAARLGALLAGPLAAGLLWSHRPRLLAVLALPLVYWVMYSPVHDWASAAGDPSLSASYYAPLLGELERRQEGSAPARVEIPFTARHWESYRVAPHVFLARGWERQLDRRDNSVFYDKQHPLTAARFHAWLKDNAVRWVALPDVKLDHSARLEAQLIRSGLPYLHEVWSSEHWRLFAVRHPTHLGALRMTVDGFTARTGLVRVRWSRNWTIQAGRGCVTRGVNGWTSVWTAKSGATLRVANQVRPLRALAGSRHCR